MNVLPPATQQIARSASSANYELLNLDPVMYSPGGTVDFSGPGLDLDPGAGCAWAVYALGGFPGDGTITPISFSATSTSGCWVGYGNYSAGCWEFLEVTMPGSITFPAVDLVSGEGDVYLVVVAEEQSTSLSSLTLTVSDNLPGSPTALVELIGSAAAGLPASFSAAGSDGGDGTITSITWTFDLGSEYISTDVHEVVTHTFPTSGQHTVDVVVQNDLARTGTDQLNLAVLEPCRDLLIIYNSDKPADLDLADYYSSARTGRSIDPEYRLGLPLGADCGEQISRADYGNLIRDPLITFLDDPGNSGIKANVKYLLMMKGVPFKIPGDDHLNENSTYSSVDNELCTLRSDGSYPVQGWLWNQDQYGACAYNDPQSFYLSGDVNFTPDTFLVVDISSVTYQLNYLVGRISAYDYPEAKLTIDRSLAADTSGNGWVILDTKPSILDRDTMVDPVHPYPGNEWDSSDELFTAAGFNLYTETTDLDVCASTSGLPAGAGQNVIAYCSHGRHAGMPEDYILEFLDFTYLPGACFMSVESFNCWGIDNSGGIERRAQGLIADFLHRGGTCAVGNAWEPFAIGVGDQRWIYDRYLVHGDNWIEASYKGLRMLSWQNVVLGDPLCIVVAE